MIYTFIFVGSLTATYTLLALVVNLKGPNALPSTKNVWLFISVCVVLYILFLSQEVLWLEDTGKVSVTANEAVVTIKAPLSLFGEIGKPAVFAGGVHVGYRLIKNTTLPIYGKGILSLLFGSVSYVTYHTTQTLVEGGRRHALVELSQRFPSKEEATRYLKATTTAEPETGDINVTADQASSMVNNTASDLDTATDVVVPDFN